MPQLQPVFQQAAYVGLGSPMPGEKPPTLSLTDARGFPGYDEKYGNPLRILMAHGRACAADRADQCGDAAGGAQCRAAAGVLMRQALGAGRGDLLRQLLTESLLILVTGRGAGLGLRP